MRSLKASCLLLFLSLLACVSAQIPELQKAFTSLYNGDLQGASSNAAKVPLGTRTKIVALISKMHTLVGSDDPTYSPRTGLQGGYRKASVGLVSFMVTDSDKARKTQRLFPSVDWRQ